MVANGFLPAEVLAGELSAGERPARCADALREHNPGVGAAFDGPFTESGWVLLGGPVL